jgi:hypothetical protein
MSAIVGTEDLQRRLDRLEQREAVGAVVDEYFSRCDSLSPESDLEALGGLFATDAVWRGSGSRYGASFGEHRGRDAIVAFLGKYASPPFFRSNVHLLANERITIADGTANGHWQMMQMPSFADGSAWLLVAAIEVELVRTEARWHISSFTTRNLVSRKIEGGWSSADALPVPQGDQH